VILNGIHFHSGVDTRSIGYVVGSSLVYIKNTSLSGGAYSLLADGLSRIRTYYLSAHRPLTVIDSVYGISSQYGSDLGAVYSAILKSATHGYSAQNGGYLNCGSTKAVKCGTSCYSNNNGFIDALSAVSIGHTSDDYNPNINTSGNANSYIRQ
jgi:hypothetical protein